MRKYILFVAVFMISLVSIAAECDKKPFVIVLDRGHDSVDQGKVVGEDTEYKILSSLVAQITGDVKEDIKVIYHNPTGERLSLEERAAQINALRPDLVISFHMSADNNAPRQATVVMNDKNKAYERSQQYANQLILHLSKDAYFSTILTEIQGLKLLELVDAPSFVLQIGNMNATRDRYYLQSNGAERVKNRFTAFLNNLNQ